MKITLKRVTLDLEYDIHRLIGPRLYYLHTSYGGDKWKIVNTKSYSGLSLMVDDDLAPIVTFLLLKHSDCITI